MRSHVLISVAFATRLHLIIGWQIRSLVFAPQSTLRDEWMNDKELTLISRLHSYSFLNFSILWSFSRAENMFELMLCTGYQQLSFVT